MENQISVLNLRLEDAPFYKREGVMGCDAVRGKGDVALTGKVRNVYVVCDENGLIKSVLAYFPDDLKAIDMDPDFNLAVKYYVRQHMVAYRNTRGEIISAAEFIRTYQEVYVQLCKGLKHAHFQTERWPLYMQFADDQDRTVKAGDYLVRHYASDDAVATRCTELLKVVEADGSLGNCSFERKIIRCPLPDATAELFTDDVLQGNVYQLLEQGYDTLSDVAFQNILNAISHFHRDVQAAEKRLAERIEKNLSNLII